MPVYLQGKEFLTPFTILPGMNSKICTQIAGHVGWEENTRRLWIIGPAIEPGATEADIRDLIQDWVDNFPELQFLSPLLDAGQPLSAQLQELQPPDDYGRQVVECLRAAILK
jgi:hypothetical protein